MFVVDLVDAVLHCLEGRWRALVATEALVTERFLGLLVVLSLLLLRQV